MGPSQSRSGAILSNIQRNFKLRDDHSTKGRVLLGRTLAELGRYTPGRVSQLSSLRPHKSIVQFIGAPWPSEQGWMNRCNFTSSSIYDPESSRLLKVPRTLSATLMTVTRTAGLRANAMISRSEGTHQGLLGMKTMRVTAW